MRKKTINYQAGVRAAVAKLKIVNTKYVSE